MFQQFSQDQEFVSVCQCFERTYIRLGGHYHHTAHHHRCCDIAGSSSQQQDELENAYLMLDPQLHPVLPDTTCQQSVIVFEQHKQLAQEYLKVQTEMALLSRHMATLAEQLSEAEGRSQLGQQDSERHLEELRKLQNEKDNLLKLHDNLHVQLQLIRGRRGAGVIQPRQERPHLA